MCIHCARIAAIDDHVDMGEKLSLPAKATLAKHLHELVESQQWDSHHTVAFIMGFKFAYVAAYTEMYVKEETGIDLRNRKKDTPENEYYVNSHSPEITKAIMKMDSERKANKE
jgi:hypothetical protein